MITEELLQEMETAYKKAEDSDLGWMDPHNKGIYTGLAAAVPALADEIRKLRAERDWWRDALREASGEQAWPGVEACVLKSFELSRKDAPTSGREETP